MNDAATPAGPGRSVDGLNLEGRSAAAFKRRKAPLDKTIVVVSGLPRSGTSMMMQMLDAGGCEILSDAGREADEDNPRGYYEYTPTRRLKSEKAWVPGAAGRAVKVIAQLLWYLPREEGLHYRVVFMERDIDEVLASQEKMLERQGMPGAPGAGSALRATFLRQLEQVVRFLEAGRIPTLRIAYHRCISDPTAVARELNAFLDDSLDVEAMAAAVDPGLYRNRRTGL